MARRGKGWLAVLALGGLAAWFVAPADDAAEPDSDKIVNQLWVEKLPKTERDMVEHLMVLRRRGQRFGTVGRSSRWKHEIELFKWGLEGRRLSLYFPQTKTKAQRTVRYWKCKDEAPKPFELCLEIRGGDKARRFYSREEWVIEPDAAATSLELIVADEPALAGMLEPNVDEVDEAPSSDSEGVGSERAPL